MTTCDAFVAQARAFKGAQWRHRGRTPHGMDCLGLVLLTARACGMVWPDRLRYPLAPFDEGLAEELQDLFGDPVADMQPGDLALIRLPRHPVAAHLAIIAGDTMIHALSDCGVCEHRITDAWRDRIKGVYRWQR